MLTYLIIGVLIAGEITEITRAIIVDNKACQRMVADTANRVKSDEKIKYIHICMDKEGTKGDDTSDTFEKGGFE